MTSPNWKIEASGLTRTLIFEDFEHAMRFVNNVAALAEKENHHPAIKIDYNRVDLTLITHDQGNTVTEKDRNLARLIDALEA